MNKLIVTTQQDLDNVPVDYDGRIIIKFDGAIIQKEYMYSVVAHGNSRVVACENSSVVAHGNSYVVAYGNSSVVACENSSVVAHGNSSVVAWENSRVEAYGNSRVEAHGNSSVVACENSSTNAKGNSQVIDRSGSHDIVCSGNARIVYDPSTALEYINEYELDHTDNTVRLYKAVHKINGRYFADYDNTFEYKIGEVVVADYLTDDPRKDCGHGIHMAYKEWAVSFGANWTDLAILELETEIDGLVVPVNGVGKVRAAQAKVIQEVSLDDCGLFGKILAERKSNNE